MSPYECYVCHREMGPGSLVVPILRVLSSEYLIKTDDNTRYYAHIGCVS